MWVSPCHIRASTSANPRAIRCSTLFGNASLIWDSTS